jgi:hypothetical protein
MSTGEAHPKPWIEGTEVVLYSTVNGPSWNNESLEMLCLPSLLHYIFCLSIVQKSNYFFPLSLCTSPIRFDVNLLL